MADQKYPGCWYCDNIIDHPEQVGLLYLGFPRCFVLIPSIGDFYFSTYEEFLNGLCKVRNKRRTRGSIKNTLEFFSRTRRKRRRIIWKL